MNKLDDLPYQKILFDGTWGIGKTKYIMDSLKDKENVYYISLFGKNDINDFYQELYYLLLSKNTAKFKKIVNKIGKITFSHSGFNITIPIISDIFESIQEKLKNTSNIIIVIDDLERKKDKFDIREIFGFVDSITKNKGIKVVLVASSDDFSDDTKEFFEKYTEKALDRIYKITTYSKDAPQKIMGDDVWSITKEIYQDNELKNLRTLEKANLFIKEVIKEVPNSVYTDKISKEDIYKVCFSVVLFKIDYKGKMKPLPEQDEKNREAFLETFNTKEQVPNYIRHYILKQNLNNSMMYSFIPVFLEWFVTGDYSKTQFKKLVKQVDSYLESTIPLYMSDKQITKEIDDFSIFIKNLDQDIPIDTFLQRLDELANIAEKTNLDFNYSVDEVVEWMTNDNNLNNNYDDFYFDTLISRESLFINEVISKLKSTTKSNYRNHLMTLMTQNVNKRIFTHNETSQIDEFMRFLNKLKYENGSEEKDNIIKEMKNNKYFLPLPLGEITRSHWTYCHVVFKCTVVIDSWEEYSIIGDVREYFNQEIENHSDEIFKYRLRHLINQYLNVD